MYVTYGVTEGDLLRATSSRPYRIATDNKPQTRNETGGSIINQKSEMRFFFLAASLATASAFTTSPAAFTAHSSTIGERSVNVVADVAAHRTRRATVVMDGKANGEFLHRPST
jgi:hypothetical protein